jgi:hypothetical protein
MKKSVISGLLLIVLAPVMAANDPALVPANVSVGKNLQTSAKITLEKQASFAGLQVKVTSDDPSRVLLSKRPDIAGTESITVDVNPGVRETPEFWVQGLEDSGEITYTATANGFASGKGKVTLTPSAIVILGPFRAPVFPTTPGANPSRILLQSVRLDADHKQVEQQPVAGGRTAKIEIQNSNDKAGALTKSHVAIQSGYAATVTEFRPLSMGESVLSATPPLGFTKPVESAAVTAMVTMPGLGVTDEVLIGQNLQIGGVVGLGQPPPPEGVEVTLTSDDPDKLLLAPTSKDKGSRSIKVKIGADKANEKFYLQALGNSGSATYTASAPGYRSRTATIMLAPSGVVITPRPYGPPDEAELFRKHGEGDRGFVSHLSKSDTMALVVWTAQLDPETHRSADITVQELRAGIELKVPIETSDPAVGAVDSSVTISGGSDNAVTHFKPLKPGTTAISAVTPHGFTPSANSTSVTAVVKE